MKIKKILCCVITLLFFVACNKRHEDMYGTVNITGRITDVESSRPIPYTIVSVYNVEYRYTGISRNAVRTDVIKTDTTDADGRYSFTLEANGQYAFDVVAEPQSPYYISSDFSASDHQKRVESTGSYTMNLNCYRSAFARVSFINTGSRDTSRVMSLKGNISEISIGPFYQDTTVYLKLVGIPGSENDIRFNINDEKIDTTIHFHINAWDTTGIRFYF